MCVKELGHRPRDELSLLGSITCLPICFKGVTSVSQIALSHLFLRDGENSHLPRRAKKLVNIGKHLAAHRQL